MDEDNAQCELSSFILWEAEALYKTNDAVLCAINAIATAFAMLSNLLIAIVMKKKHLIKTPCHILIFSLTLVDFIAALVPRPLYIDLRLAIYHEHVTCNLLHRKAKVTESAIVFCVGCSFLHMVCIARDRCNALCHPERYRTPGKMKATTWLACACWVTWGIIVILIQWAFAGYAQLAIRGSIAGLLLSSLAVYHIKTILVVYRYNHSVISDINSLEVQRLLLREKKVLTDMRLTLAIFSVLFIPTAILSVIQPSGVYANVVFPWSMTITLLHSSVNPVIQLWRNRRLLGVITRSRLLLNLY